MAKIEKEIYPLTSGQEVVNLQAMLSIHKNVINIMSSLTLDEDIDFEVLQKAFNLVAERNDCMRMKFFKKGGKLVQIFEDKRDYSNIPVLKFETEEEQNKFIEGKVKTAIAFKKGVVAQPWFIKTFDGKSMVLMKVCHLVLDVYGINIIYKDLFDCYNAIKDGKELPEAPTSFEKMIQSDLKKKFDDSYIKKNEEFYRNYFATRENPYYAGVHGEDHPIWQKQLKKKRHAMKLFLFKNQTKGYAHDIKKELVDKVMAYCAETKQSPANFLFYALSITASKMNGNVKNMLPMELCNCRGTVSTKKGAGTKAQSVLCYTSVDHEKSFKENFDAFCVDQNELYKHVGFPDMKVQALLHEIYKSGFLEVYYGIAFSFIPVLFPEGSEFMVYSNGSGALPCYIAQLYDVKNGNIKMAYDAQVMLSTEKDIEVFHNNYLSVLEQITANPNVVLNDVKF